MSEKGMIFNSEMVRALLDGRKTQTRRLIKPRPWTNGMGYGVYNGFVTENPISNKTIPFEEWLALLSPIQVGDRIWVKEIYHFTERVERLQRKDWVDYEVSSEELDAEWFHAARFMPRWASRITLEITNVSVERIQDISEQDSKAKGAYYLDGQGIGHSGWRHDYSDVFSTAKKSFNSVWIYTFKVVKDG